MYVSYSPFFIQKIKALQDSLDATIAEKQKISNEVNEKYSNLLKDNSNYKSELERLGEVCRHAVSTFEDMRIEQRKLIKDRVSSG